MRRADTRPRGEIFPDKFFFRQVGGRQDKEGGAGFFSQCWHGCIYLHAARTRTRDTRRHVHAWRRTSVARRAIYVFGEIDRLLPTRRKREETAGYRERNREREERERKGNFCLGRERRTKMKEDREEEASLCVLLMRGQDAMPLSLSDRRKKQRSCRSVGEEDASNPTVSI